MANNIQLSYSSISTFLECRRKFWWNYVRRLVPIQLNQAFLVGEIVHFGISEMYAKNENAIEDAMTHFNSRVNELRSALAISPNIEQELVEQEYVVRGMLNGYKSKYSDIIEVTEHIKNEHELRFVVNENINILAYLDNILLSLDGKLVHEIKTTKSLTPEYVKNIQNSLQAALYFHGNNHIETDESNQFVGILYDVIRKPSIRVKKNEAYDAYLQRLIDYYEDPKSEFDNFHMEVIKFPLISKQRVFETVEGVGNDILSIREDKSRYYCNDRACLVRSKCVYYDICHFGENPSTMLFFKEKNIDESNTQILIGE